MPLIMSKRRGYSRDRSIRTTIRREWLIGIVFCVTTLFLVGCQRSIQAEALPNTLMVSAVSPQGVMFLNAKITRDPIDVENFYTYIMHDTQDLVPIPTLPSGSAVQPCAATPTAVYTLRIFMDKKEVLQVVANKGGCNVLTESP